MFREARAEHAALHKTLEQSGLMEHTASVDSANVPIRGEGEAKRHDGAWVAFAFLACPRQCVGSARMSRCRLRQGCSVAPAIPCADDAIKGEEAISRGADMRDLLSVLTLASGDAWT